MKSYDYAHRQGFREITWQHFDGLSNQLVEGLAGRGVEMVLGVARAGLFPATVVACKLRLDLHPLRLTRREGDRVVREHPVWKVRPSGDIAGKTVVVVDEMADSGQTQRMVADEVAANGAARVYTASLVAHTWAEPFPDVVALTSDALVIFPWDKRVYIDGAWQLHPELSEAIAMRNPLSG